MGNLDGVLSNSRPVDWYWNEDDEEKLQRGLQGKVALEAVRGDLTLAELAAKHAIRHAMIAAWKRQAIDGVASMLTCAGEVAKVASKGEVEMLLAKIGHMTVERDI
nr:hypothetical protein [uncultured Sphingomonas sp.]